MPKAKIKSKKAEPRYYLFDKRDGDTILRLERKDDDDDSNTDFGDSVAPIPPGLTAKECVTLLVKMGTDEDYARENWVLIPVASLLDITLGAIPLPPYKIRKAR